MAKFGMQDFCIIEADRKIENLIVNVLLFFHHVV